MRWPQLHHRTERLTIRSERKGHTHLLALVGELYIETVGQLDLVLRRVVATDAPEILVDISGVDFIDSDGLKLFIKASARSQDRAGRLLLVHSSETVLRVFRTTGLESRLPFADRQLTDYLDWPTPR